MKGNVTAIAAIVAVFLLWEAGVRAFKVKPVILPPPSAVLADLFSAPGWYLGHAWTTLLVTLGGFAQVTKRRDVLPASGRTGGRGQVQYSRASPCLVCLPARTLRIRQQLSARR